MTIWQPISKTVTQYVDTNGNPYSGAVLKAYLAGTTTVTNIATSSTGSTQVTSVALNASGFPAVSGNVIIPHISADYKISLYPTQTAANANSGALWTIDNISNNVDDFKIRSVKDFGVSGDSVTDDTIPIQEAENILSNEYIETGNIQYLYFSEGDYAITNSIQKKSGVHWLGVGRIRRKDNNIPTGSAFSLVTCENIMEFDLSDITLENCPHDFVSDGTITRNSNFGNENSCLDIQNCYNYNISNVRMKSYSIGVRISDSYRYRIINNNFKANNSKTLESIKDGTFVNFASYQQTSAINQGSYGVKASDATGNVTSGSNIITGVSSVTGYFVGEYVRIRLSGVTVAGFEIPAKIVSINSGTNQITLDKNSGATASGITILRSSVIFDTNEDYIVSGNIIDNVGLDTAIMGLNQTYDQTRGKISDNIIVGGNTGISVYRGSFVDPSDATPTYAGNCLVENNIMNWTTENGYYQRGVIGCQVLGNKTYRCGTRGAYGNASSGAFVFRVNPFEDLVTTERTFVNAYNNNVSNDHITLFMGNQAINHGVVSGSDDAVFLIEHDNIVCENNSIVRTAEFSTNATGRAISVGNGKDLNNAHVVNNIIIGNFTNFIAYTDSVKNADLTDFARIEGNTMTGNSERAITIDAFSPHTKIFNNTVSGDVTEAFVYLRNSPYSEVVGNRFYGNSDDGIINIARGTTAGELAYLLSQGTITRSNRRGGTIIVTDNEFIGTAVNNFVVAETATGDISFTGRCKTFKENYINGALFVDERSGGTPATNDAKTWQKHDFCPNSAIAVGQPAGKYCITSGTYGSTTYGTGDVTSGSAVITNVSSLDGYGMGIFLTPSSGYSAPAQVIAIDITNSTITLSTASSATATGVTLTASTPTFASTANLA